MSISATARKFIAKHQAERRLDKEIMRLLTDLSTVMSEDELLDIIHGVGPPKWHGHVNIEYVDMPIDPLRANAGKDQ